MSVSEKREVATFSVVLVGAGNMGGALLQGWVADGFPANDVCVIDPAVSAKMSEFLRNNSIQHVSSAEGVSAPDVLMVAVKPQMMDAVLPGLSPIVGENTVVVSVAAGTTIRSLEMPFGGCSVVRSMPNTPSLVGRGITVACANSSATHEQVGQVDYLLRATGKLEWVEEECLIDAVTAVSGSGPAYVFHLAECMTQAGVNAGLPLELAANLASETVSGAGELMRLSPDSPEQLRKNVTSPNGTTAAALEVLMGEGGMPELLKRAVLAAQIRSRELS